MQAREAFESSLALSRDIGYARGEAYALRGLAAVANQQDDPAGDTVLRSVASQLSDNVAPPGFLGRIGGEEFLIVLPDSTLEQALASAETLRQAVNHIDTTTLVPALHPVTVTVSIGLTLAVPGDGPGSLLQRADAALYRAKRSGRDCVMVESASPA